MAENAQNFLKPTPIEQFFNRLMGSLTDWGIGPKYMQVLEVAGRKSGKIYRTPVNLMDVDGALYLVAPRGETNWVRNARSAEQLTLKRGRKRIQYKVEELPSGQKAVLLKEYLERYEKEVQRYFTAKAGSELSAFADIEEKYPVLQLDAVTD